MGQGLVEFKENDHSFKKAFFYRLAFTTLFTGAWYQFSKSARLFNSSSMVTKSLPIAFLLGYYFSKGIALHISAAETVCDNATIAKKHRYIDYKNELRNKKLID
jgi:hypothetical protein